MKLFHFMISILHFSKNIIILPRIHALACLAGVVAIRRQFRQACELKHLHETYFDPVENKKRKHVQKSLLVKQLQR